MTFDADLLRERVAASSIRSVRVLAWRDLDDPEAGGSELHMDEVLARWAAAGLRVEVRTSAVANQPPRITRRGYAVERRGGRYLVFPSAAWYGWRNDRRHFDALVEIWNGIPFFGPLWFRGRRLVWLHHVHAEMWRLALPQPLAAVGWWTESELAPRIYRHQQVATLSNSSGLEIREQLGLRKVAVVPVGISPFFSPGGERSPVPLVVAVGRLVPVKQYDKLLQDFARTRQAVPTAQFVIVGEGYLRDALQSQIAALSAQSWITLAGHVTGDELRDLYRRAWVVANHSLREGWGMTITEAAACGTPAVVSDIAGHRDAVRPEETGLLVPERSSLGVALAGVLTDDDRRARLAAGALAYAAEFTWDRVALRQFSLLEGRLEAAG